MVFEGNSTLTTSLFWDMPVLKMLHNSMITIEGKLSLSPNLMFLLFPFVFNPGA